MRCWSFFWVFMLLCVFPKTGCCSECKQAGCCGSGGRQGSEVLWRNILWTRVFLLDYPGSLAFPMWDGGQNKTQNKASQANLWDKKVCLRNIVSVLGWGNSSADKDACRQAQWPGFDAQDPCDRIDSCPLTSTWVLWLVCMHACTHTYTCMRRHTCPLMNTYALLHTHIHTIKCNSNF